MSVAVKPSAPSRQERLLEAQKLSMGITLKTIRAGIRPGQIERDVKKLFNNGKSSNRSSRR